MERLQDPAVAGFTYLASFRLVIPRWATLGTGNVPDQCLSLPPSLSAGVPYQRPGEEDEYAQPNICYRLKAHVKLNSLQDSILPRTLEASRRIAILPCSPPMPPTDTSDFPAEFISSASNTSRAFFFGSWYMMTLSMQEPAAISLQSTQTRGSVNAMLHVEIKAPASGMGSTRVKKLHLNLKNLLFKIQPILRAKTFYSTQPFHKMPGETMLFLKGPVRLKDEVMKLDAHDLKASSWQHDIPDEAPCLAEANRHSSTSTRSASVSTMESADGCTASPITDDSPWAWSTRLSVPITVQPNLPPTFCSVTASRQYSLIMRIRVAGVSIKDFILEMPLQILYTSRKSQERCSTFSTYELQPSFTSASRLEEVLQKTDVRLNSVPASLHRRSASINRHLAQHPDEDLPDYS